MADSNTKTVLSIRDMCKSFGRNRVLDHIDLDVKENASSAPIRRMKEPSV